MKTWLLGITLVVCTCVHPMQKENLGCQISQLRTLLDKAAPLTPEDVKLAAQCIKLIRVQSPGSGCVYQMQLEQKIAHDLVVTDNYSQNQHTVPPRVLSPLSFSRSYK